MFPQLEREMQPHSTILFGPHARQPYEANSFFNISAMSYGSLSRPAVRALSRGAAKAGIWLNTGEGGLSPWHLEGGCDIVFQVGTAKYGVRDQDGRLSDDKLRELGEIPQVKMIELKLSQGAKPGKGGILPGKKVTEEIAEIRGIPVGEDSISPNRHPEISSLGDLLDMINHIRNVSGLPTGFKAVIGAYGWMDEFFRLVHERGIESAPDFITVDSGDGGTGAAPQPLMDEMGLPIRESLPMVVDKLEEYGLRQRVRVIASGKRVTPSEVAWALCAGADTVNSARGFMFSLGCIQALKCNRNTCPTGITTHDKRLQRGLDPADKAVRVANYAKNMIKEVSIIAHSCGVPEPRRLKRYHARVVTANGLSVALSELHPPVETRAEYS
jgi:glutamate synthase domain-containing protein 2